MARLQARDIGADDREPPALRGAQQRPPRWSGGSSYSSTVSILKFLLPASAVGLLLLLIAWPQVMPSLTDTGSGATVVTPEMAENLVMINPRYEGVDDKNRPFTVTAESAVQVNAAADVLDLVNLKADMAMEDGSWVAVTSQSGRYDRTTEILQLTGSVDIFQDQGFEMVTAAMTATLKTGEIVSTSPVEARGPSGELQSAGLQFFTNEDRVIFNGPARLIIYELAAKDPAAAPAIPQ